MKLSSKDAREARERRLAYEANMAIEGLHLHPDDQELLDQLDTDGVGYEEGVERMKAQLRERGVIPAEEGPSVAAE